ncbi:MAG: terminase family protein [Acidobacteriia bacterium]|nr:terminase family protein [Terriglobia bacterium]
MTLSAGIRQSSVVSRHSSKTTDHGRRTRDEANPKSKIENPKSSPQAINLLPYQRRWVEDDSPLKIVVKARQIGYSFAATLRAVFKCLERRTTWVFLSKGERQSRLLMEKVQDHIRSCGIVARTEESTFFEGTSLKQLEVRFPNGSVIYGLPANPDTARGYSGHVTLDEFAFHADAEKIYAALFPTITRGYGLEVISTPNGTQGKFYELAKAAGLTEQVSGVRYQVSGLNPDTRHPAPGTWSAHSCDIYEALREGLRVDIQLLRAGCEDESAWQQEFCCQFVSTAENFLPPELLASCLSAEATTDSPLSRQAPLLTGLGPASAPRVSEGSRQSAVSRQMLHPALSLREKVHRKAGRVRARSSRLPTPDSRLPSSSSASTSGGGTTGRCFGWTKRGC